VVKALLNNSKALRWRVMHVPQLITGKEPPLRDDEEPMSVLFGRLKQQRDAFVHCEPGPQASSRGHVATGRDGYPIFPSKRADPTTCVWRCQRQRRTMAETHRLRFMRIRMSALVTFTLPSRRVLPC
jgi:hypothetical protein